MNDLCPQDVCVSGIGVISTFGETHECFFQGIYDSKCQYEYFSDKHILKNNAIPIRSVYQHKTTSPENRILSMGSKAILNALRDRDSVYLPDDERVCLIVGSGIGLIDQYYYDDNMYKDSKYFSSLSKALSEMIQLKSDSVYIGNACSAGSQAISYGMDLLRTYKYDMIIAGGIDILSQAAYAGFLRLNAIDTNGCSPFDKSRKGIAIGEGAVFYILERRESINERSKIYCTLLGSGITCDAYHIVQMKSDANSRIIAMRQAISAARVSKTDIDLVVAHGTGTVQNDDIEARLISEYFGEHRKKLYVTAPKGMLGHTGGASGAFGILIAIGSFIKGMIPFISNLKEADPKCDLNLVTMEHVHYDTKLAMINTFAFGGTNVVILCKKEESCVTEL